MHSCLPILELKEVAEYRYPISPRRPNKHKIDRKRKLLPPRRSNTGARIRRIAAACSSYNVTSRAKVYYSARFEYGGETADNFLRALIYYSLVALNICMLCLATTFVDIMAPEKLPSIESPSPSSILSGFGGVSDTSNAGEEIERRFSTPRLVDIVDVLACLTGIATGSAGVRASVEGDPEQ